MARGLRLLTLACLLLTFGCGGGGSDNAALHPWPATIAATEAPRGGPPSPPSLPAFDPQALTRVVTAGPLSEDVPVYTLELSQGWNMVSLPVVQVTSAVLGAGIHPTAFAWDPGAGNYDPVELGTPASLNAGTGTRRGLWVYSSQASELQVTGTPNSGYGPDIYADLHSGWNLLGVPYLDSRPFSETQVRGASGQILFLAQAAGLEVAPTDPAILMYGYGFVYDGSDYDSVGLNNPENSFAFGQAMWVYVHGDGTRLWYQIPAPPTPDVTFRATLEEGATLVAVDQEGNLFTGKSASEPSPSPSPMLRLTLEDEGPGPQILALPAGATYRFYVMMGGGIYPLYEGEVNRFQVNDSLDFDFGTLDLVEGRAVPQNPPTSGGGVVGDGEDHTAPSFEDPGLVGQTLDVLLESGAKALNARSFLLARAYLGAAHRLAGDTQSQEADAARFLFALARVVAMGQEYYSDGVDDGLNDLGDFLDAAGFDLAYRSDGNNLVPPATFPATTPTGEQARVFLATRMRSELEAALRELDLISPSFQYRVNVQGGMLAPNGYEVDYGDVLAVRAACRGGLAGVLLLASYDLGGNFTDQLNAGILTIESFLAAFPTALNHKDVTLPALAGQHLDQALVDLAAAFDHIVAEEDPQEDDLLNTPDLLKVQEYRGRVDTWRQALRQATEVQDPEGNTATVELARLFDADGLALRPFLCPYDGDEPAGPFQGHPFGDVYHGFTPGGPMDPNFDGNEDGLPDLLSTGEPSLVARWQDVAPAGQVVQALARSADGNTIFALCGNNGIPRSVSVVTAAGAVTGGWSLPWPVATPSSWGYQSDLAVDPDGNVTVLASWYSLYPENARRREFCRYTPTGTLLERGNCMSPVPGLTGEVLSSLSEGLSHGVGVDPSGRAWTWGYNWYGQLGDGTSRSNEVARPIPGFTGVAAAAAGRFHTLLLKGDGTVWACGQNGGGQLGNGTYIGQPVPVQVQGLSGVAALAAGFNHSLALKQDGTVWAWGENGGRLGDGTTTSRSTPVQMYGLSEVEALAAGDSHSLALKRDGTVWACGSNRYGELGDGTTTDRLTPVQVQGLANMTDIAAAPNVSLAMDALGQGFGWGRNDDRRLALDLAADPQPLPVELFSAPGGRIVGGGRLLVQLADGALWRLGIEALFPLGNDRVSGAPPTSLVCLGEGRFLALVGDHLEICDASGICIWSAGSRGNGAGQFDNPSGMDLGPDGAIHVSDAGNNRFQRFSPEGQFLGSFPATGAYDLDVDSTGRLYGRAPSGHVIRFSSQGKPMNRWLLEGSTGGGVETLPGHVSLYGAGRDILKYSFPYAP